MNAQKVVVIQDASGEVSSSAIRWALQGLSLRPGDKLTLLAVLHQVNTPSTFSNMGNQQAHSVGYKTRVDPSSMFGANQRIIDTEVAWKIKEYDENLELVEIFKMYQALKVEFKIAVVAGPSAKAVALQSAENLKPTWVILDRQMKKDKKYFLKRLSCGISRMKRNNSIELLRGPKPMKPDKLLAEESRPSSVTYDEMMPGSPEENELFSIELLPTLAGKTEPNQVSQHQELTQTKSTEDPMQQRQTENSTCTICTDRRPNIGWGKSFTLAELQDATRGFSSENSLSESRFEASFRGELENGVKIVVKKDKIAGSKEAMKFKSEIQALCRARHENVVMLLGYCIEGTQRLLIYEYACSGSLKEQLSNHHPGTLTWKQRLKIAVGSSRGLNYLHQNNIIHGDLSPSNILLTHDMEPLLGGFGLMRMQSSDQKNDRRVEYLAPEYRETGELSTKTDMYSFGAVLLELITGGRITDKTLKGESMVAWARPLLKQKRYMDLVDPKMANSYDALQLYGIAQLTEICLSKNPKKRLGTDEVASTLEYITEGEKCFVIEDVPEAKSGLVAVKIDSKRHEQRSPCREKEATGDLAKYSSTDRPEKAKSTSKIHLHYAQMLN